MRPRDTGRAAVYSAEHHLDALIERGGTYSFYGSQLTLPERITVGSPESAQAIVDHIWRTYDLTSGLPGYPPKVIASKAKTKALYRGATHSIYIPFGVRSLNTLTTLIHEVGHAAVSASGVRGESSHGSTFRRVYVDLLKNYYSPEASLILMDALALEVGL